MLLKKAGMVTVGVAASLLAAAPLASATECHEDSDHHETSSSSSSSDDCSFLGGTGEGATGGTGSGAVALGGAAVGGLGGNNLLNVANCSDFLNHNLNGNQVLSGNSVDL